MASKTAGVSKTISKIRVQLVLSNCIASKCIQYTASVVAVNNMYHMFPSN